MTAYVKDAGVWKPSTTINVRDAGVWKPLSQGYIRDAGVWKPFGGIQPGSVTIYPTRHAEASIWSCDGLRDSDQLFGYSTAGAAYEVSGGGSNSTYVLDSPDIPSAATVTEMRVYVEANASGSFPRIRLGLAEDGTCGHDFANRLLQSINLSSIYSWYSFVANDSTGWLSSTDGDLRNMEASPTNPDSWNDQLLGLDVDLQDGSSGTEYVRARRVRIELDYE